MWQNVSRGGGGSWTREKKKRHFLRAESDRKVPQAKSILQCFLACNRRKVCQHKVTIDTESLYVISSPSTPPSYSSLMSLYPFQCFFKKLSAANIHRGKFELGNYMATVKVLGGAFVPRKKIMWALREPLMFHVLPLLLSQLSLFIPVLVFLLVKAITCNYVQYLLSCLKLGTKGEKFSLIRYTSCLHSGAFNEPKLQVKLNLSWNSRKFAAACVSLTSNGILTLQLLCQKAIPSSRERVSKFRGFCVAMCV